MLLLLLLLRRRRLGCCQAMLSGKVGTEGGAGRACIAKSTWVESVMTAFRASASGFSMKSAYEMPP